MRIRSRKGFLLSLDAVIAIGLILTLVLFIGGLSATYSSPELRYQRLYYTGKDVLMLLENARISQLQEFPSVRYYQDIGVLGEADQDKTLLDVAGSLWSSSNATLNSYGANITADVLNSTIPASFGYMVVFGGDTVYQSGDPQESGYLARLSSIVSGVERGKPIDGYFARAYPSKVGKTGYEYFYLGGYVGEGNITFLVDLPAYDGIKDMAMELDASSDFSLYINGDFSGDYAKENNYTMRSENWTVPGTYYGSLRNGTNTVLMSFNETYGSVGGGYFRIIYNTSDIGADLSGEMYGENASRREHFPGIDGIMNLYSSVYVPGTLKGMDFFLHYETLIPGLTAYVSLGDVLIYENNETGEMNVTISDSSVLGNLTSRGLGYSYISGKTVPLRIGLQNISYVLGEAGAADVAMITDRTGSMTSCDVETSCAPGLCDSSGTCHDRRSLVAQSSDRAFVNTILDAPGRNYVGLIGYGEQHGKTCSFLELTNDNSSLQARIDDYNYGGSWQDCGYTCISCGVTGATELLQEKVALYNLSLSEDIDRSPHAISSGTHATVSLGLGALNKSRFVKARLSLLAESEDVKSGYQQCVLLNGHYLGRVCTSSEGSSDWHTCSYAVDKDWVSSGSNSVDLTRGDTGGCYSGGTGSWSAKDVKLSVWEFLVNQSAEHVNSSSLELGVNFADSYAEIPEAEGDLPNPVDFSSGLNQSGDTFGLGSAEDGWDTQEGAYGYSGACDFNGVSGGELEIYSRYTSEDKSCAYGIEFNVTQEFFDLVDSGGRAEIAFNYEWDESGSWEPDDQVWVKARLTSPAGTACSGSCYLGSSLDSAHPEGDGTDEIYTDNDPDGDYSSTFSQDISAWIQAPGTYYLDLGGKVLNSESSERGYFRFDDIAISAYSAVSSEPVIPFSFSGVNVSRVNSATLSFDTRYIDPSKKDCVYVNDNHVTALDYQESNGSSGWQGVLLDVPVMYLQDGENLVEFSAGTDRGCNRTGENDRYMVRNVALSLTTSGEHYQYMRKKSMLIMSDGEANTLIGDCRNYGDSSCPTVSGWTTPADETISKACEAHDKYNISIYAVVFGDAGQDAEDTLRAAACCDNCSNFFVSTDSDELVEIYSRIAQGILNASFAAQTIQLNMDFGDVSRLYPDSFVQLNYSSSVDPPEYGEISLTFESDPLESMSGPGFVTDPATMTKEGWFYVPQNVEVVDAKVTSYSSNYWTDRLYVRNSSIPWTRIYWLDDFGALNYTDLGDPFIVNIPASYVTTGANNSVRIGTGFSLDNGTGGSPSSRIIYTGRLGGITLEGYSEVFAKANGSTVKVYYDIDGDNVSDGYETVQIGSYPSDVFDPESDSVDNAFMRLLDNLNVIWDSNPGGIGNGSASDPYDGGIVSPDNPIDFQIPPDIRFDSAEISGVPSMWGPVEMEVRVWI